MSRDYYNHRTGNAKTPKLTLSDTAEMVAEAYRFIDLEGWLQQAFGFFCVDEQEVPGREGYGFHKPFLLETGIRIDGRIEDTIKTADEITLFTLIEFVHVHVAMPVGGGWRHTWNNCGMHYRQDDKFDATAGRAEWRKRVNKALRYYDSGYQVAENGTIVHIPPDGMTSLLQSHLPTRTSDANRDRVTNAVRIFQLGRATRQERKQAVRELIDVLEPYRREVKAALFSKDESDLFNIANNFAFRHNNDIQKDDYDDTFLAWLFYLYLSTVHLIIARVTGEPAFVPEPSPPPASAVDDFDDIPF